ncbi:sec-independent protein translocase protein TatC [Diaminobutyricimonas aerilata]|uniref:Sec-independent protein translocase protein TatC n=1 Tax=Diaminobutyricimonas aerilata TaxID=1162967 RepID=A0A2M9CJW9_9MICO|nr:sec-independent protein translocase protein TatC [Diaminobutyricimonas aerilata]
MAATRWKKKRGRDDEGRMTLGEHLLELRKRLTISAIAILVAAVGGFIVSEWVLDLITEPIIAFAEAGDRNANLNFQNVTTGFDLRLQIALTIGIVASCPVWLYQVWAFLVPGLVRKEKIYAISFLGAAIPLFFAGCAAGWLVMPHIVELMLGFVDPEYVANLDAKGFFDFVLKLLLATGIAFVLPVFLVLLNFVGVLSAKAILKGWRVAILVIFLFTAIATPAADVLSMFLLAIPMIVLYFIAAGIAALNDRRVSRRNAQLEESLAA